MQCAGCTSAWPVACSVCVCVTVTWLQMNATAVTTSMCSVIHVFSRGRWHLVKMHRSAHFAGIVRTYTHTHFSAVCHLLHNQILYLYPHHHHYISLPYYLMINVLPYSIYTVFRKITPTCVFFYISEENF